MKKLFAYLIPLLIFYSCNTAKELEEQQKGDDWIITRDLARHMAHDFRKGLLDNRKKTHSVVMSKADLIEAINQVEGDTVYLSFATYTKYRVVGDIKNRPTLILKLKPGDINSGYLDLGTYKNKKSPDSSSQGSGMMKTLQGNLCPPPPICDRSLQSGY
ncbi:MAG TPA: hypothetical protein VIQ00_04420 [Chitinophagaceae bacterium]|jgi:hypothetical protein